MAWLTRRLELSPLDTSDAPGLFAALNDPEVGEFIGGPDVTTLEALRVRIQRLTAGPPPGSPTQEWLNFTVRASDLDDRIIGRLQATLHGGWAEVAWVLGLEFWGQGYGTEGAAWLVDHLDRFHGVRDLWATVDPANLRSIGLLRTLGFVQQPEPYGRIPESLDDGDLVFARAFPVPGITPSEAQVS
jgi:RimJ/RimL family protein N-acetyltransferase